MNLKSLHWTNIIDTDVIQVYACEEIPELTKATTKCTCCTKTLTAYKVGHMQVDEDVIEKSIAAMTEQ